MKASVVPSLWNAHHVGSHVVEPAASAPVIHPEDVALVDNDLMVWDAWPIQSVSGEPFGLAGGVQLWMALAASASLEPQERHHHARIHLVLRGPNGWTDLGPAMPEGFSPGSREWSGSTVAWSDSRLTLFFTATGRRGESEISFEQRLFAADCLLEISGQVASLGGWSNLREVIKSDPAHYMTTHGGPGIPGKIKAFRDPAFFRDPHSGADYLVFAGSQAGASSEYNGVIGLACAGADPLNEWTLLPPVISAEGLNNELERPHLHYQAGLYYLFWSTQQSVFDPTGPVGPTGLYGMVSDHLTSGWEPLNGSGLVLANPREAPTQAYSWLVLSDLSVTSFIDDWGAQGSRGFGGTFAPFVQLRLEGKRAMLEPTA